MASKPTIHCIRTKSAKRKSSVNQSGHDGVLGGRISKEHRWQLRQLINKFHGRCVICDCEVTLHEGDKQQATRDHILPLSKGGADTMTNLQLLCLTCNKEKSDSTPESSPSS